MAPACTKRSNSSSISSRRRAASSPMIHPIHTDSLSLSLYPQFTPRFTHWCHCSAVVVAMTMPPRNSGRVRFVETVAYRTRLRIRRFCALDLRIWNIETCSGDSFANESEKLRGRNYDYKVWSIFFWDKYILYRPALANRYNCKPPNSRRPPAEKKIRLSCRFCAGLFFRRSPQVDKFNVASIEKTK